MADPQAGATLDQLERVDRKTARMLRRSLGADETIDSWAIGLDDQTVALTERRALIVKRGFRTGAPFGGRLASVDYADIIGTELRVGRTTGIFEIRAEGMPMVDAWAYRARRGRVHELSNGLSIANAQTADFTQIVHTIRERARRTHHPTEWIPPPGWPPASQT